MDEEHARAFLPDALAWHRFDAFPGRVQIAILVGHPSEPGLSVIRVKVAAGAQLQPHRQRDARMYTVISGMFYTGVGEHFDGAKAVGYPPGSFLVLAGDTPHFHWAKSGEFVVQIASLIGGS